MGELYRFWNEKINVISRKDIDNLYIHHILHSLSIGLTIRFAAKTHVLDAGTGGGLPGIPLAILFPDVVFTLVDSIGKKIRVVSEIATELNLQNVEPVQERLESMTGQYDFVTGRAVKNPNEFYQVAKNKISSKQKNSLKNGILYLGGGEVENQVYKNHPRALITPLSEFFTESYFLTKKLIYIPVL